MPIDVHSLSALLVAMEVFDRLMPLHLRVDAEGRIIGHGPTLAKLGGAPGLPG